jgi:hypothetical protein
MASAQSKRDNLPRTWRWDLRVDWEAASELAHPETFAEGTRIRELHRLVEVYGGGKPWKQRKGFGRIRLLATGEMLQAALH